jgi:DNA recombination protein RmuC
MVEVIAFVVGLVAGGLALWLWARGAIGAYRARLAASEELYRAQVAASAAQLAASEEKLALVERTQSQWEEHLRATTGEAIERSSSSLLQQTEAKLAPIKETLARFDEQARLLEQSRLTAIAGVGEQLRAVAEGQNRLQKETGSLVTALRAPHVRGRWGEVQLKRVVELAGMVAYCDFVEQASERDDEGRLLRPDLVVKLPGGKSIVVDSKAPLEAYLDAAEAEDDETRRAHLARHARLVRDHMTKLGQKRYWQQFQPAPDFVVMFLGDEAWFRAALDHDPALLEAGVENGVVPASPTTLIALLRTVAYGWQQETVAESARSVSKLGRELYDRLGVFAGHLAGVGKSLDSAMRNYNNAVGSFETRVLVTARKFPELGTGGDELPEVPPVATQPRPVLTAALEDDVPLELPIDLSGSGPADLPVEADAA